MTTNTLAHSPHTFLTNIEGYISNISVRELPTCPLGKWADTGQTPTKYSLPHWLEWKGRMGKWSSIKAYS